MPDAAQEVPANKMGQATPGLRSWRRAVIGGVVAVLALGAGAIAARAYRAEAQLFLRQRHDVPMPSELKAFRRAPSTVSFQTSVGDTVRGWYIPSENRAAVILTHGTTSDRRDHMAEALLLADQGFGVLVFDFPGHGESEGKIAWMDEARAALTAATDYMAARPDVEKGRLGIAGFSMGGVVASQVAAQDSRLAAVGLFGTPSDLNEQTHWEYRKWGMLSIGPALLALKVHGLDVNADRPKDKVAKLAPRPLLIVAGSQDGVVPPSMASDMFAAAGEPKELMMVEGAGHGNYLEVAPQAYRERLLSFFSRSLLPAHLAPH